MNDFAEFVNFGAGNVICFKKDQQVIFLNGGEQWSWTTYGLTVPSRYQLALETLRVYSPFSPPATVYQILKNKNSPLRGRFFGWYVPRMRFTS